MQEAALRQPGLLPALDEEGKTQMTRYRSQALVREREQRGLGWPRAGFCVKTRTRQAPVDYSSCEGGDGLVQLRRVQSFQPRALSNRSPGQTLAGCISLDCLLRISNLSHCWNLLTCPMPCQDTQAMLWWPLTPLPA